MRLGITGGTGYLGRHIVAEALTMGHDVRVLVRGEGHASGATPVPGDVRDAKACRRLAEGCEALIHAAGLVRSSDRRALEETNVRGTGAIAEAALAAGVPRLVHVSSTGVYGHPGGVVEEGHRFGARNPYEASKARAEELLQGLGPGLRVVVVRPSNVIGDDHPRRPLLRLMRRMASGRRIPDGGAWTNYIGVQDVARGTLAALQDAAPDSLILNTPQTLEDLVSELRTLLGGGSGVAPIPRPVASVLRPLVRRAAYRIQAAERLRAIFDDTAFRSRHDAWLAAAGVVPRLAPALTEMGRSYRAKGLL